jgi:hypothetical protein
MGILQKILMGVVLSLLATPSLLSQEEEGEKRPEADLRVGHFRGATYGVLDASMRLGRVILPHVMVRGVAMPDHEGRRSLEKGAAIGGGYVLLERRRSSVVAEALVVKSWSAEGRATYLEPITRVEARPSAWLRAEVSVFPSLRLGKHKTTQWVVETARAEVAIRKGFRVGVGWGALEIPSTSLVHSDEKISPRAWQHAPETGVRWAPKGGKFGTLGVGYQGGLYVRYKTP